MPAHAVEFFVAALVAGTALSSGWCAIDVGRRAHPRVGSIAILLGITLVGIALRYFPPPHHAMYLDEPWYAAAACSLARSGEALLCTQTWSGAACAPYGKALGWPVALAPWALLTGCSTAIGIELNRVVGSATIPLVAVVTRCAGGRRWQALAAAAVAAIHPTHVAWSVTGETNVAAAAALLAGLAGALFFLRTGARSGAGLAISALALATAIRPESLLAAAVSAAVAAAAANATLRTRLAVAGAIVIASGAAALSGLPLWSMNESISSGAFLSPANVPSAIARIAEGPSLRVHGVVLVLALIGTVAIARRQRAAATLLLITALAMAVVVLAYDRFDERMLLAATVTLLPLAAGATGYAAAGATRSAIAGVGAIGVVALLWYEPLRAIAHPPDTQVLETRIALRAGAAHTSEHALIVAAQPAVLAAAGLPAAMTTQSALGDMVRLRQAIESDQPVYFLCDMFCEPGFAGGHDADACEVVLSEFTLTPVVEESLHGRTYGLYRLSPPGNGGIAPRRCPREENPTDPADEPGKSAGSVVDGDSG